MACTLGYTLQKLKSGSQLRILYVIKMPLPHVQQLIPSQSLRVLQSSPALPLCLFQRLKTPLAFLFPPRHLPLPHTLLPLQTLLWPCNRRQLIPIQRLHQLPQPFVAIILLIPHVLVIFHLPLPVECEGDEAVDGFGEGGGCGFGGVVLAELEG